MHPEPALTPPARPRRVAAAAGLAASVLLLHGWLLGSLPELPGFGGRGEVPRVLQVRQIVVQAAPAAVPPTAEPAAPPVARAPARRPVPAAGDAPSAPTAEPEPAAPPPPATGGSPLPVYATRLPPPVTLQYAVQREGAPRTARGLQAELRWRPAADGRYELTLSLAATGWASIGAIDENGLAPERQVETRRGRELRAANFQRDSGRITFSGPQLEFPLLPGAQDRLSWLLQLAAVLEANPALAGAGSELTLFVAGPRGDAGPWVFRSEGTETAEVPAGVVAGAVHLRRSAGAGAEKPYDTRVDVWLDPARHHLPVRLKVQNRAELEPTDFVLQALDLP